MTSVLEKVVTEIAAAPDGIAALTLYALVSTLEFERAGYLFKLAKLRDLSADQRRLAYGLMELIVENANASADWRGAKARMDELVRAG